jgi:hypothetical protein
MTNAIFLSDLFETGLVRVAREPATESDRKAIEPLLAEIEAQDRLNLPGEPPPFDASAAAWAASMLYRGAQLLADRDVSEETLRAALADPGPDATASTYYSVDLIYRFLPDLITLARRVSQEDPLVAALLGLIAPWPLSSVGVTGAAIGNIEPILAHPCLRQLYVDRILAHGDVARLEEPRVREAVREALGAFSELAPAFAAKLAEAAKLPPSEHPAALADAGVE